MRMNRPCPLLLFTHRHPSCSIMYGRTSYFHFANPGVVELRDDAPCFALRMFLERLSNVADRRNGDLSLEPCQPVLIGSSLEDGLQ